ncbi:MAG: sn-glycerol-3-phosphate ABC transporter ATP-binding protein UgpC [Anaeromyxobacter sp.]
MAEVVLRGVHKTFGKVKVIQGVDLDIAHGEFVVFVGPSGCGKSTLLRLIAGLEDITAGKLFIDGKQVNDALPSQRGIAMVFQSYALYPHMTVYENMAFGLKLAKADKATVDTRVREAARVLQIEPLLERKPRELSGGQRQRVAIGRAITRNPKVFLFDEPLSNLDAALRVQTRLEIARLKDKLDATMIYVTHDQVEAMTLADRIVVLNAGRVEQVGTPLELYEHPQNLFVAGFLGSPKMNFLKTTVVQVAADGVTVRAPSGRTVTIPVASKVDLAPGAEVTVGVRPEDVSSNGGGDVQIPAKVMVVEQLGSETYVYVRTDDGGQTAVARAEPTTRLATDAPVLLGVPAARCHLFDANGLAVGRPRVRAAAQAGVQPAAPA